MLSTYIFHLNYNSELCTILKKKRMQSVNVLIVNLLLPIYLHTLKYPINILYYVIMKFNIMNLVIFIFLLYNVHCFLFTKERIVIDNCILIHLYLYLFLFKIKN